ncbi:MAG: acylphosphatase [Gemmatimonadota bacterium]|nr:acylphosphatase [Gemmatimonadota bacterium]
MAGRTLHLLVIGRVQGVGFRWFVAEEARRLDLAGWVKNNPDGSVEICALGDSDAIASLQRIAAKGPIGASVSRVELLESSAIGDLSRPFSIAR